MSKDVSSNQELVGKRRREFDGHPFEQRLGLRIYPDPVLRRVCEPVERFDGELRDLLCRMRIVMRESSGIGLAAPQVGILKRFFVCERDARALDIINPRVTDVKGQSEMAEGCLSLPGIQVNVTRNKGLFLRGYDSDGQKIKLKMAGLWARMVQHEVDHLNGILICDHGEPMSMQSPKGEKDRR